MNLGKCLQNLIFLIVTLTLACLDIAYAQDAQQDRASALKQIERLRAELKTREEAYLTPSADDRAAYATSLPRSGAGLMRLMPREDFETKDRLSIRGGGAYYSFARLTHEYGYGSDLQLEQGELSAGFAGADHGFLVSLGDIPLESLSLESAGVVTLASYAPPTVLAEARTEQRRSSDGFEASGFLYKRSVPAVVNSTYVIRSVCYGNSDVLVAFRVMRREAVDGSLVVAWRMLKKYEAPQLIWQDSEQ